MPKFTSDELAEIRENTERLEASKEAKSKKPKDKSKKAKSVRKHESSLQEKLIAPLLLFLLLGISYVVMMLYS